MNTGLDSEFIPQLRDALAHLYDYAYLQRHPLAERLVSPETGAIRTRAQELRRILLDAIEALKPGDSVPMRASERRPHSILFGLYVEGRPQQEVASSLGIGGRQLRRDRVAAFEALASVLRDRHLQMEQAGLLKARQEPLRRESERLAQGRERLDLHELVQGLLPLLSSMAREHGVDLEARVGKDLPKPSVNRTIIRQVLIGLASQALSTLPLTRLSFQARPAGGAIGIGLGLGYREADVSPEQAPVADRLVSEAKSAVTLIATLGGSLVPEAVSCQEEIVWVLLPLQEELTILVVDDNQELFALFERYVTGHPFRLVHAASVEQALAAAQSLKPHIVTIDLMMPGRDGWELLQALRAEPATKGVPTIVCSVLEEPKLALSLGAQGYLKKPVGQADLLRALEAVQTQAWAQGGSRGSPAGS
jgi:CheY-like chemotaxis protein